MINNSEQPISSGGIMPGTRIDVSPSEEDFETAAAGAILAGISSAIQERGRCLIAFSGGRTPRGVYRRLGDMLVSQSVDLSQVYLIFVDERMVPPEDSESNYGMIRHEFIARIPISPFHVFRIKGELDAENAAYDYELDLRALLPLFDGRCDLVLLGVGEDGHTASLFPGADVLKERQHKARAVFAPRLQSWRVTLTLPTINAARAVFFLAAGRQKADIIGRIFDGVQQREDIPATLVKPDSGNLTWILDAEAASRIPPARLAQSDPTLL